MASLDDLAWPVRTARLTLRRPAPGDAETTYAYRRLPEVAEWLTFLPADLASYTERFDSPDSRAVTVIVEREGTVVGELSIRSQDGWSQKEVAEQAAGVEAEIGYVIHPAHQGHGYATEAARAALAVCFDGLRVRRVTAGCFVANEPSWRIMETIGMRREYHSIRDGLHRTRGWLDGFEYAILAEEWHP